VILSVVPRDRAHGMIVMIIGYQDVASLAHSSTSKTHCQYELCKSMSILV
jgi:hypothetical protein